MADPISAAVLRAQSGDLDDFCETPGRQEPVVSFGWTSLLSPSYWARRAEDTLKKLIDRHLLKPHEDDHPLPPALYGFASSSSSPSLSVPAVPASGPSLSMPSFSTSFTSSHQPQQHEKQQEEDQKQQTVAVDRVKTSGSKPIVVGDGSPQAALGRSASAVDVRDGPRARLRRLHTGTSWTRLGPYFASKSKKVMSAASDSESQVSDGGSSSRITAYSPSTTADEMSSTLDDISSIDLDDDSSFPRSFDELELSVCPAPSSSSSSSSPPPPTACQSPLSSSPASSSPLSSASSSLSRSASVRAASQTKAATFARPATTRTSRKRTKRPLSLSIFACSMADPRKGSVGEDAFFISRRRNTCGVADGVGAWTEQGVDSGVYSRTLVSYVKRACERRRLQDPLDMLKFAYGKISDEGVAGSTTICILTLQPASSIVYACNLGDSGFLVARDGQLILRSTPQQHGPNHPFQLGAQRDRPEDSDLLKFSVHAGDVIVVGTDGLFDNLHVDEILTFIQTLSAKRLKDAAAQPPASFARELAELLLNAAVEASADPEKYCPINFNSAARPLGGKLDDITVLVAQVVDR